MLLRRQVGLLEELFRLFCGPAFQRWQEWRYFLQFRVMVGFTVQLVELFVSDYDDGVYAHLLGFLPEVVAPGGWGVVDVAEADALRLRTLQSTPAT